MFKKCLIKQRNSYYLAFPSFITVGGWFHLFFRETETLKIGTHGGYGVVKRWSVPIQDLVAHLKSVSDYVLEGLEPETVFKNDNEMDAIVSQLETDLFCLATRTFNAQGAMKTFLSVGEDLNFSTRQEVRVKGVDWMAFYGKPVSAEKGYFFTAYGGLTGECFSRPLILRTVDFRSWELFSALSSPHADMILNESSLVLTKKGYFIFTRQDSRPFGIWYSQSEDLKSWSPYTEITSSGHAPIAICQDNDIYIGYRSIESEERASMGLIRFSDQRMTQLDQYCGNIFDGAYCDIGLINDCFAVVYYMEDLMGSTGSPTLKIIMTESMKALFDRDPS